MSQVSESIEEFGVAVESLLMRYGTSVIGKHRLLVTSLSEFDYICLPWETAIK